MQEIFEVEAINEVSKGEGIIEMSNGPRSTAVSVGEWMKTISELQKGKGSKGRRDSSGRDTRNEYWHRATEANSITL